jgi:hypothetical protein
MGNEYGVSPLMLLDILSPFLVLGPAVMTLFVFGPLVLYPLARWKAHRAGHDDPQLGIKVLLSYFGLIAFHMVLLASLILIYTLFSKASASKGDLYRTGFALLIPAGSVLAAHLVFLKRTNQERYPGVRRLFLGYNLAITGLVGFVMLMFAFQVFFRKGSAGDGGRLAIAGVLIYVGAWAACGIQFGRLVIGDAGSGPSNVIPPSAPVMMTPQPSGPVLPSLSAGTYPPIDQK